MDVRGATGIEVHYRVNDRPGLQARCGGIEINERSSLNQPLQDRKIRSNANGIELVALAGNAGHRRVCGIALNSLTHISDFFMGNSDVEPVFRRENAGMTLT